MNNLLTGALLIIFGVAISEVAAVIGKKEAKIGKENRFSIGLIASFPVMAYFLYRLIVEGGPWGINPDAWLTYGFRIVVGIIVMDAIAKAVIAADRTTFRMLRTLSVPLALLVDVLLVGYVITGMQMFGIMILLAVGLLLYRSKSISMVGAKYVLVAAVGGMISIELYKYNIDNFHTIPQEAFWMNLCYVSYFAVNAFWKERTHLFFTLSRPLHLLQALTGATGSILQTYGFAIVPPSIALSVKRGFGMIISLVSGIHVFHEEHVREKIIGIFGVILAVIVIVFGG